jgi:hypothetical protein
MRLGSVRAAALAFVGLGALSGCATARVIPLTSMIPVQPPVFAPLELATRSSGIHDPVPVSGAHVAFAGLEASLGYAVATSVAGWAEAHRGARPDGWQLLVELIEARADRAGERLLVTVGARATLRARRGNLYLAQTQVHCHATALVEPAQATPVFHDCLLDLGRELAGWLGGVQP